MPFGITGQIGSTDPALDPSKRSLLDRAGDFWLGTSRQIATAPFLEGDLANINRYGFYGDLAQSQAAGRNIAGQQQGLADALRARAEGRGAPSLAEMQLQQSLDQQQKQAAGALAGIRGMNPAAAQRLLLSQKAQLGQQAAGQAAQLRAGEQLAAQQALGQQLAGMRGAEGQQYQSAGQLGLGQEKFGKEAELAVAKANQEAELERQRIQTAADKGYNESAYKRSQAVAEGIGELGKGIMMAADGVIAGEQAEMPSDTALSQAMATKTAKTDVNAQEKEKEPETGYGKAGKTLGEAIGTGVKAAAKGIAALMAASDGGKVSKGKEIASRLQKAEGDLMKMDNKKNDTIPALLSEGEAVIPRSVMNSPNPPLAAAKFVEALLAKKQPKEAKKEAIRAALSRR